MEMLNMHTRLGQATLGPRTRLGWMKTLQMLQRMHTGLLQQLL